MSGRREIAALLLQLLAFWTLASCEGSEPTGSIVTQLSSEDCRVALQYQLLYLNATGYTASMTVYNNKRSTLPGWHVTWLSANTSSLMITQISPVLASSASASLSSGLQTTSIPSGGSTGFLINATYYATSEDVFMGLDSAAVNSRACQSIQRSHAKPTEDDSLQLGYDGCSLRQLHRRMNGGLSAGESLCTQNFCCAGGPEASPPPPPPTPPPPPPSSPSAAFNPIALLSTAPESAAGPRDVQNQDAQLSVSPAMTTKNTQSGPHSKEPVAAPQIEGPSVLPYQPAAISLTAAAELLGAPDQPSRSAYEQRSLQVGIAPPPLGAPVRLLASSGHSRPIAKVGSAIGGVAGGLAAVGAIVAIIWRKRSSRLPPWNVGRKQRLPHDEEQPHEFHLKKLVIEKKSLAGLDAPINQHGKIAMLAALTLLESADSAGSNSAERIGADHAWQTPPLAGSPQHASPQLKHLHLAQAAQRRWSWSGECLDASSPTLSNFFPYSKMSEPVQSPLSPYSLLMSCSDSPQSAVSIQHPSEGFSYALLPPSPANSRPHLTASPKANLSIDFMKDITIGEKLGSGAFGTVYKGTWKGQAVAVKIMLSACMEESSSSLDSFRQEVRVLSSLQHNRIVCLLGACMAPPNICLVEELAAGGSLYDKLHCSGRNGGLPYKQVLQLALDIADAMAYLHPTIVHRDLKSSNVLLDEEGRAMISDFGIAAFKDRTFISTRSPQAGTPSYMAPEMFEGGRVSEKVDQYAFAMLIWEALTGAIPWRNMTNPMQVIYVVGVLKKRPRIPSSCPEALSDLLKQCWHDSPDARPPFGLIYRRLQVEQQRLDLTQGSS